MRHKKYFNAPGAIYTAVTILNNPSQCSSATEVINSVCILTVELTQFTAELQNDNIELKWSTASERNNSHFEIEASHDGILWKQIGRVAGANNSNTLQEYNYLHEEALLMFSGETVAYYRLNQVDFDGAFKYSPIRLVSLDGEDLTRDILVIEPNPVSRFEMLNIRYKALKSVDIFDIQGRMVMKHSYYEASRNLAQINISALSAGTYMAQINGNLTDLFVVTE